MVERLRIDHDNARYLAEGLAAIDERMVNLDSVQTNIVNCTVSIFGHDTDSFMGELQPHGIRVVPRRPSNIRMVTHRQITRAHIDRTLEVMRQLAYRPS